MLRIFTYAIAFAAAAISAQIPEFSQEYQQRLGGAIGELEPIVAAFDADAMRSDLSREEALAVYGRSHEQFLKDRGKSMVQVFDRYDHLIWQRDTMSRMGSFVRPVVVLYSADEKLVTATRRAFSPSVPLTISGLAYALLGFLCPVLAALGVRGIASLRMRARRKTDL